MDEAWEVWQASRLCVMLITISFVWFVTVMNNSRQCLYNNKILYAYHIYNTWCTHFALQLKRLTKDSSKEVTDSKRTQRDSTYREMGVVNSFAWKGYNWTCSQVAPHKFYFFYDKIAQLLVGPSVKQMGPSPWTFTRFIQNDIYKSKETIILVTVLRFSSSKL